MQFALNSPPDSLHFAIPWKTHFKSQNPISKSQNPISKSSLGTIKPSNSLKTTLSCNSEEVDRGNGALFTTRLPVVIRKPGIALQYFWDGDCLKLVQIDEGSLTTSTGGFSDKFGNFLRLCKLGARDFFIPKRVSENYLDYVKWKLLHRVFSSALQVLATQAMFRAIGIGYSPSLSATAALNWVLKDGLGRLSRCIYTASLASAFDTNLKRVRFLTSIMFSLSIGVEMVTPVYPHYFLLLASVANIAKQISLGCYLATNSSVNQSFAIAENVGEVSAKGQIQNVCFDILGLVLAALLNNLCKTSQRLQAGLPCIAYPIFAAIDLYGIYHGLEHVHLRSLTKNRLEIIMNTWIQSRYIPLPAEVSKEEGIDFLFNKDKKLCPIRIGELDHKHHIPNASKSSMLSMKSLRNKDFFFICMESRRIGLTKTAKKGILLYVREEATTTDVTKGLLQACYIRKRLLLGNTKDCDILESDLLVWSEIIEESKQCAQADIELVHEKMLAAGWSIKNILLSPDEQKRYSCPTP